VAQARAKRASVIMPLPRGEGGSEASVELASERPSEPGDEVASGREEVSE